MPELEPVETAGQPTEHQVNQLIWAEQGVPGKGIPRTWRAPGDPPDDEVILEIGADGVIKMSRDGTTAPAPVIVDGTPAGGSLSGTYPNPTIAGAAAATLGTSLVLLDYERTTDLANGLAIAAETWTTLVLGLPFTVTRADALVTASLRGHVWYTNPSTTNTSRLAVRLYVDGATEYLVGGGIVPAKPSGAVSVGTFLGGVGTVALTGLTVADHQAWIQVWAERAGTYTCRPASNGPVESLGLLILEHPGAAP